MCHKNVEERLTLASCIKNLNTRLVFLFSASLAMFSETHLVIAALNDITAATLFADLSSAWSAARISDGRREQKRVDSMIVS